MQYYPKKSLDWGRIAKQTPVTEVFCIVSGGGGGIPLGSFTEQSINGLFCLTTPQDFRKAEGDLAKKMFR